MDIEKSAFGADVPKSKCPRESCDHCIADGSATARRSGAGCERVYPSSRRGSIEKSIELFSGLMAAGTVSAFLSGRKQSSAGGLTPTLKRRSHVRWSTKMGGAKRRWHGASCRPLIVTIYAEQNKIWVPMSDVPPTVTRPEHFGHHHGRRSRHPTLPVDERKSETGRPAWW